MTARRLSAGPVARPRLKICGITRPEDARLAESLGADFIGLIFAAQSKRQVTVNQARAIAAALTTARPVGVFVDTPASAVEALAGAVGLWGVQHPDPPRGGFADAVTIQVIPHDRIADHTPVEGAAYRLIDTHVPGQAGGTGRSFDWSCLPGERSDIFLAGGLRPDNIAAAARLGVHGLDLSSGVEAAPGFKDPHLLRALFAALEEEAA